MVIIIYIDLFIELLGGKEDAKKIFKYEFLWRI